MYYFTRYRITFRFFKGNKIIYKGTMSGGVSSDNLKGVRSTALLSVVAAYGDNPEAAGATSLSVNVRRLHD